MSATYECRVNGKEFTITRNNYQSLDEIAEIASWEYFYEHRERNHDVGIIDSGNPTEGTGFIVEVKKIEDEKWSKFDINVSVEPAFHASESYD